MLRETSVGLKHNLISGVQTLMLMDPEDNTCRLVRVLREKQEVRMRRVGRQGTLHWNLRIEFAKQVAGLSGWRQPRDPRHVHVE